MFERYTEKARRVLFFARYEASTFGSPYIETEFLLLGLLRESKHAVTRWLGEGDWQTILREEVRKRCYGGETIPISVDLPLSNESKRVLAYAAEEVERLGHHMIGTEHLFLGLLRESQSGAAQMLIERGVEINTVREAVAKDGAEPPARPGAGARAAFEITIVPEAGKALVYAWQLPYIPAVGETVRVTQNDGQAAIYEVVNVEWELSLPGDWLTSPKVAIHLRKQQETP